MRARRCGEGAGARVFFIAAAGFPSGAVTECAAGPAGYAARGDGVCHVARRRGPGRADLGAVSAWRGGRVIVGAANGIGVARRR